MQFDFTHLFCYHAAVSFDKQRHLTDLVGALDWHFDMTSGLLNFGNTYQWQAQILGTESFRSNTWLWAWANNASNIPAQLLGATLLVKLLGEHHQIAELIEPQIPLDVVDGRQLAMMASGICKANACYRCPYEGGAIFVLIKDAAFPEKPVPPLAHLAKVFPQVISEVEIPDHRLALSGWLDYYRIAWQDEGSALIVREADYPLLIAKFDDHNRLTDLKLGIIARGKA